MNLFEKVSLVRGAIQLQLDSLAFTALGNAKVNLSFIVDNKKPEKDEDNVFQVSSVQEVEQIALHIYDDKKIINNVQDYNRPLYLTVLLIIPR
ncbi:hypothetical protein [Pedobacter sp. SL55]|uniref:hypothetical protein n=1 Tax=Pedobacter sp. SL55 TaxID=2995161 RepID=UPI00226F1E7F|nr:hypothetical protein [Pedobacter sp. SL55]WAC40903.1 hypothetical protein OVA16_00500 [Pedobacter sp. SL55]